MPKDIERRIVESFGKDDREQLLKYMDWINSSIQEYVQTVRRNATFLLLLVAAFELVVGSRNAALSIGSFSISRDSIALVFVPAIAGFLLMQIILDTRKASQLYSVFTHLFRIWSPKAAYNNLDLMVDQPQPAYWTVFSGSYPKSDRSILDRVEEVTNVTFWTIVQVGTLAFAGQAYYLLFPTHTFTIFAWTASLLVTLFCFVVTVFLMWVDE